MIRVHGGEQHRSPITLAEGTHHDPPKKMITAVLVGSIAAISLTGGAIHPQGPTPDARPRLEKACARIPNLQLRATDALNRINGGAEVVGSLAWLDVQIGRAEAQGMTELVTVLSNRRDVRLSSNPLIEKRQARLVEAAEFCASKGIAV